MYRKDSKKIIRSKVFISWTLKQNNGCRHRQKLKKIKLQFGVMMLSLHKYVMLSATLVLEMSSVKKDYHCVHSGQMIWRSTKVRLNKNPADIAGFKLFRTKNYFAGGGGGA